MARVPLRRTSLDRARLKVQQNLGTGIECPCCRQFCKIYKRKLNSGMARSLIWLVRTYLRGKDWINVPKRAPGYVVSNRDYAKLAHWELIEQMPNTDPTKRTSGMWRPTQGGIDFVFGRISVAARVHLYNNEVVGFSSKRTTIEEALGDKFDYQELMSQ